MIPNHWIEVQTSPVDRPLLPAWFARSGHSLPAPRHKRTHCEALTHQVRLVRNRFGSYETLDFLALLIGYAVSGERTLADFFHRAGSFEAAFMALFGRADLPHRATLSRFLASVDRPCVRSL